MGDNSEIVVPNMGKTDPNMSQGPTEIKNKRKGQMITGIVLFCVSLLFTALTLFYLLSIFTADDRTSIAIAFVVYILTFGWVTFIPALVCSIIGLVMSAIAIGSSLKSVKKTSIIFLILNILVLISLIAVAFIALAIPSLLLN